MKIILFIVATCGLSLGGMAFIRLAMAEPSDENRVDFPPCYMSDEDGEVTDLSALCDQTYTEADVKIFKARLQAEIERLARERGITLIDENELDEALTFIPIQ